MAAPEAELDALFGGDGAWRRTPRAAARARAPPGGLTRARLTPAIPCVQMK